MMAIVCLTESNLEILLMRMARYHGHFCKPRLKRIWPLNIYRTTSQNIKDHCPCQLNQTSVVPNAPTLCQALGNEFQISFLFLVKSSFESLTAIVICSAGKVPVMKLKKSKETTIWTPNQMKGLLSRLVAENGKMLNGILRDKKAMMYWEYLVSQEHNQILTKMGKQAKVHAIRFQNK